MTARPRLDLPVLLHAAYRDRAPRETADAVVRRLSHLGEAANVWRAPE